MTILLKKIESILVSVWDYMIVKSALIVLRWTNASNLETVKELNTLMKIPDATYKCLNCNHIYKEQAGPTECPLCGHIWIQWIDYEKWRKAVDKLLNK
jgi:Zn finger protein HypA/HybF involved in hydrogenase expression